MLHHVVPCCTGVVFPLRALAFRSLRCEGYPVGHLRHCRQGVQGGAQPGGDPPRCAPFAPIWPGSSPWVTAVGGTQFSDHTEPICDVEQVWFRFSAALNPYNATLHTACNTRRTADNMQHTAYNVLDQPLAL